MWKRIAIVAAGAACTAAAIFLFAAGKPETAAETPEAGVTAPAREDTKEPATESGEGADIIQEENGIALKQGERAGRDVYFTDRGRVSAQDTEDLRRLLKEIQEATD